MASNVENDISQVISELSKIDDAAENVLIHTEANKKAYDEKIEKNTAKFDKELDISIMTQLNQYETEIKAANAKELNTLRKEIEQTITQLDDWYEKNHSEIARNIVNDFIKE